LLQRTPCLQLDEVERQEADDVEDEAARADVAPGETAEVADDQAALEVPGPRLDDDVGDVDEVGDGVGGEPERLDADGQLAERLARDARPQVVQHGGRQRRHPAEHEPAVRRHDVRPASTDPGRRRRRRRRRRPRLAARARRRQRLRAVAAGVAPTHL